MCSVEIPRLLLALTTCLLLTDGMVFIVLAIIIGWKVVKRTRFLRGEEVDLITDLKDIDDYTEEVRIFRWISYDCTDQVLLSSF